MKRFSEQFKKESERLTLKASEQQALKERVISYMEYHPLPAHLKTAPNANRIFTEPFTAIAFNFRQWQKATAVCAVMIMIVVPFAAERTAPGDILYPVKVNFTEELRSTLTFSPYEKVAWETKRLERRLAEARLLASEGKLTPEAQIEVAAAVKSHSEAAQKELSLLRATDSEEAAIAQLAFASSLEAQTEALSSTMAKTGSAAVSSVAITDALSAAYAATQQENNVPSFARLLAKVEMETTRAYELFNSLEATKNTPAHRDIERRLDDINRKLEKAMAMTTSEGQSIMMPESIELQEEREVLATTTEESLSPDSEEIAESVRKTASLVPDTTAAIALLREVLQSTQKLILYMSDLELAAYVTVDELVPVTPTDEEQRDVYTRSLTTLITQVTAIEDRVGTNPTPKIKFGLSEIAQAKAQAERAVDNANFTSALQLISSAHALADDILRLIETQNIPVSVPASPASSTATSTPVVASTTESRV